MPPDSAVAASTRSDPLYSALEERVMARDQKGASEVYYSLVREGRPLPEMLREAVRIHAPYTHVPYHERLDDGFVNFVNNDHCLLSARASLNLSKMLPGGASGLPLAQTIWYIPTGLDIWNQKIAKAPGHYARGFKLADGPPPVPVVHWPDQAPQTLDGPLQDRLGQWMTLVHRGRVVDAYRVFLGLMENPAERRAALAELAFAGLIDVQDRSFHNRSYTTGHKSFRARATIELGEAIGWESAHDVLYAGALDIAVGPRWYSLYEAASNSILIYLEGQTLHAVPYSGTTEQERAILANNKAPLDAKETEALIEVIVRQPEPDYLPHLTALLKAGKSPRAILDAIQVGVAEVVIETHGELNFSLPQHCYEYCNTLGWFWDKFEHPQRLKLLYLAAAYLNQAAWHQKLTGELTPPRTPAPSARPKWRRGSKPPALPSMRRRRWAGSRPRSTAARIPRRWCARWRSPARGSATIRTTRKSPSACSRTTARTGTLIAAACCWPPRSTRHVTASTAIRWIAAAASAWLWAFPS
jgi:hypothetical protein